MFGEDVATGSPYLHAPGRAAFPRRSDHTVEVHTVEVHTVEVHSANLGACGPAERVQPATATRKQTQAAKKNVRKAATAAKQKRSPANMPKSTKTALGQR